MTLPELDIYRVARTVYPSNAGLNQWCMDILDLAPGLS